MITVRSSSEYSNELNENVAKDSFILSKSDWVPLNVGQELVLRLRDVPLLTHHIYILSSFHNVRFHTMYIPLPFRIIVFSRMSFTIAWITRIVVKASMRWRVAAKGVGGFPC